MIKKMIVIRIMTQLSVTGYNNNKNETTSSYDEGAKCTIITRMIIVLVMIALKVIIMGKIYIYMIIDIIKM